MKKLILLMIAIALSGCLSANYQQAVKSTYIANDEYEVVAKGTLHDAEDKIRGFLYRAIYETCAKENRGFEIKKIEDASWRRGMETIAPTVDPELRATVLCRGQIDPKLKEKYAAKD